MQATWTDVDSNVVMNASDAALTTRFTEALEAGDRFAMLAPALFALMRDHRAGQPRAAHYGPASSGGAAAADEDEDGEPPTGHHDPAGDAGITPDRVVQQERQVRQLMSEIIGKVDALEAISWNYPANLSVPEQIQPTVGDGYCKACWKDRHYPEPIAMKGNKPRFADYCRWCGEFKATEGFEPPTWMLEARHRGDRITQGMVAKARRDWEDRQPKPKDEKKAKESKRGWVSA